MKQTRIYQYQIDAFKRNHRLFPESLEELREQHRGMDLLSNGTALAGIIDKFVTGEFIPGDGVEIKI